MANAHAVPSASTPKNVTVRSARPREYLTEREIEKLMDAARGNRVREFASPARRVACRRWCRRVRHHNRDPLRATAPRNCGLYAQAMGRA
jgi:hypothetical protein